MPRGTDTPPVDLGTDDSFSSTPSVVPGNPDGSFFDGFDESPRASYRESPSDFQTTEAATFATIFTDRNDKDEDDLPNPLDSRATTQENLQERREEKPAAEQQADPTKTDKPAVELPADVLAKLSRYDAVAGVVDYLEKIGIKTDDDLKQWSQNQQAEQQKQQLQETAEQEFNTHFQQRAVELSNELLEKFPHLDDSDIADLVQGRLDLEKKVYKSEQQQRLETTIAEQAQANQWLQSEYAVLQEATKNTPGFGDPVAIKLTNGAEVQMSQAALAQELFQAYQKDDGYVPMADITTMLSQIMDTNYQKRLAADREKIEQEAITKYLQKRGQNPIPPAVTGRGGEGRPTVPAPTSGRNSYKDIL